MEKISWQTVEYFHTHKNSDWYWIVGIVTISFALIAIILNNLVFGILILVSGFTLSLFASRRPGIVNVEISNTGVTFGDKHYSYSTLDSFWVETREGHPRLFLKSKEVFSPYIVIFIEEEDPEEIHHVLSEKLREERHTESLLEKIMMYLGF